MRGLYLGVRRVHERSDHVDRIELLLELTNIHLLEYNNRQGMMHVIESLCIYLVCFSEPMKSTKTRLIILD